MSLQERISKIKKYFVMFNVAADDGCSYALVKFPKTWVVPEDKSFNDKYKVEVITKSEGTYFFSEISNGIDCIFDAIDYIIEYYNKMEEKTNLLLTKINELKELFLNEDIEKLKTLEFTFSKNVKPKKVKKNKVEGKNESSENIVAEGDEMEVQTITNQDVNENIEDDNDLMSMAKDLMQ